MAVISVLNGLISQIDDSDSPSRYGHFKSKCLNIIWPHVIHMTIIDQFEKKCQVCGKTSMHPVLMSTNSFGYPDLDLRPAPMQRDTMDTWLDECPHCGYVASSLEIKLPRLVEAVDF